MEDNCLSTPDTEYTTTWLETPPTSQVNPPVETKEQILPFGKLKWENFERLCYRLARLEAEVEHCQLYGIPGQRQEGIDIYAKLKTDSNYIVYQCKREDNFGPSKIKSAVSKFLEGKWVDKTSVFVLCTKESLESTDRADEIETQRSILRDKGITFAIWDCIQLSTKLKDHPKIIDDFFGRSWVEAFLGKDKADKLSNRLDIQKVIEFRKLCAHFYKHVFNNHDPGLSIAMPGETKSLPLEDRYVVPDINEWRSINILHSPGIDNAQSIIDDRIEESVIKKAITDSKRITTSKIHQRQSIETWLKGSTHSIVLGSPGSGKSTLLRFIAIDMLRESPRLVSLSKLWGQFLPVWVPFALWTKVISEPSTASCSLSDLLYNWLKSYDEDRLWPLVERALDDERLLLLVDGLDEWTNELAAATAFSRLQIFIKQHNNIPAIITSRPNGFRHLGGIQDSEWQIGELSDLSLDQQKTLSRIWFTNKIKTQGITDDKDEVERIANFETDKFIKELNKSNNLRDLAKVPLLLCLLIYHKIHNVRLPQNRFKAYNSLIELLISKHPLERKIAASLTDPSCDFSEDDLKKIFALIAYSMQESYVEGIIDQSKATNIVEDYLKDIEKGLGLDLRDSRRLSSKLIDIGENSIGIFTKAPPTRIRFFHRVFQESLASYYLSCLSLKERTTVIQNYCTDPQWKDVILGLFYITNCSGDVGEYIGAIREKLKNANIIEQYTIELLLAEAAFGDFNCTTTLARELAKETFSQVEMGLWMPHREDLLHCVLDGLRSTKVKELAKSKVREWFPCRTYSRASLFEAMANWPIDEKVLDCIWRGLRDERIDCQRSAARALAKIKNNDPDVGYKIELIARHSTDSLVRVSAIEALLKGWQGHKSLPNLLESAGKSSIPELRLIAILGRIQYNNQTEADLDELLKFSLKEANLIGRLEEWHKEIVDALVKGWPKSEKIKRSFLEYLNNKKHIIQPYDDIAVRVLLDGYPQDTDVAQLLAEKIKDDEHIFYLWGRSPNPWSIIAKNFKNNEVLISAIDDWMQKQSEGFEPSFEVSLAALTGCTEISKSRVLETINKSRYPHWPANALIEGWGMQDPVVAQRLQQLVFGPASEASAIAHLIPQIIIDKTICRDRLMELLKDPNCKRPDFVLAGLEALNLDQLEEDIVDTVLNSILNSGNIDEDIRGSTIFQLSSWFPSNNFIKEFAVKELMTQHANYPAIAWTLGNDEEVRRIITEIACPLPTGLRMIIAERMEDAGEDEFALSLLGLYDQEINGEVTTQASISYHRRLKLSGLDITAASNYLSKSISCNGPNFESRRAAAFCGLVFLNRLDIMVECKESKLKSPCRVPLRDYAPNIPLIKTILQEWESIKKGSSLFYVGKSNSSFPVLR